MTSQHTPTVAVGPEVQGWAQKKENTGKCREIKILNTYKFRHFYRFFLRFGLGASKQVWNTPAGCGNLFHYRIPFGELSFFWQFLPPILLFAFAFSMKTHTVLIPAMGRQAASGKERAVGGRTLLSKLSDCILMKASTDLVAVWLRKIVHIIGTRIWGWKWGDFISI